MTQSMRECAAGCASWGRAWLRVAHIGIEHAACAASRGSSTDGPDIPAGHSWTKRFQIAFARGARTSALVHTGSLLGAIRATQGSVGERVTPTWITVRDLPFDEEEGEKRVEEEVRDRQARRTPKSARHAHGGRSSRSVLVAWW